MMKKLMGTLKTDKRKVKKLVEAENFDLLIMSLICMDALALGMLTMLPPEAFISDILFILDRLFMGIFIVEMIMKIYVYGKEFFKKGWNLFDFCVIAISSSSIFGYFIILRCFRLFRMLKYFNKIDPLKKIVDTFLMLIPNLGAFLFIFAIFLYVFAIMGVFLYGRVFVEFSTLGESAFTLLQVFTLDGWAESIVRPIMTIFPHSWFFFVSYLLVNLLLVVSFLMSIVSEIVELGGSSKPKKTKA